jgi:hypothetical protein
MTPCHDGRKRSAPRPQCADFGTRFARKRRSPHGEAVKVQTAKAASGRRSTRRRLRPGREQIKSEGRQEGEYKCGRTWVNGHANEAGRGARRQQRNIALPAHCRARACGMVTGSAAGGRRSASTGWTRVGAHGTDAGRAGPQGTIYSTPRRPSGWTWWPAPDRPPATRVSRDLPERGGPVQSPRSRPSCGHAVDGHVRPLAVRESAGQVDRLRGYEWPRIQSDSEYDISRVSRVPSDVPPSMRQFDSRRNTSLPPSGGARPPPLRGTPAPSSRVARRGSTVPEGEDGSGKEPARCVLCLHRHVTVHEVLVQCGSRVGRVTLCD